MALDPAFVAFAMSLCTGQTMDDAEASELATVLECREELLAHLLTRTDFLNRHSDVRNELLRVAGEHGFEAQTRRPGLGATAASSDLSRFLNTEITKAIAEAEILSAASKLDGLVQGLNPVRHPSDANPSCAPERWIKS